MKLGRPRPLKELLSTIGPYFEPAYDLCAWAKATFIVEGAPLANSDHVHLQQASIGMLWTNVANSRHSRMIVGQAEIGQPRGSQGKWSKARAEFQITQWFVGIPDFILTFDATYCDRASDAEFCALVEHELYHCGQERDEFNQPKFRKDGSPAYAMRGHDVEEFVGVVRRYGALGKDAREFVRAANSHPEIARAKIASACGTCLRLAA